MAQTYTIAQRVPKWRIGDNLDWGRKSYQVTIWKAWQRTTVDNRLWEYHAPCTLETSFI